MPYTDGQTYSSRIRLPDYYTVETDLFYAQLEDLANLADFPRLDDALNGVLLDIVINPPSYQIVPKTQRLRVAKADGMGVQPGFKIWFTIEPGNQILLRAITLREYDPEGDDDFNI